MFRNMWNKRKTFDGVNRKIKREYQNITNYQPNKSSDTEPSCEDIEKNKFINRTIYSQARVQSTSNEGSVAKTAYDNKSEDLEKPPELDSDLVSYSSASSSNDEELVCTDHKNYFYFIPLLHTV